MTVASDALGAIGLWLTRRERQQDRDDTAVASVLLAINKTKLYLANIDNGVVEMAHEADHAYAAGYVGSRAVRTWQE